MTPLVEEVGVSSFFGGKYVSLKPVFRDTGNLHLSIFLSCKNCSFFAFQQFLREKPYDLPNCSLFIN